MGREKVESILDYLNLVGYSTRRKMLRILTAVAAIAGSDSRRIYGMPNSTAVANNCASFVVGSGTGCAWMCNYCRNVLCTPNYYFVDDVCQYQPGGCIGNPVAGQVYTCCSAAY